MSNVIPFRPRTSDHIIIKLLLVRGDDGSLNPRYFVSDVVDDGCGFGCFDSESYPDARAAALECGLPIVDKTGERA